MSGNVSDLPDVEFKEYNNCCVSECIQSHICRGLEYTYSESEYS